MQALLNSLGVASIHCYTPALIFWSSTECLQALKSVVKRTIACDSQSKKIDYPILVMSDRDKALALAALRHDAAFRVVMPARPRPPRVLVLRIGLLQDEHGLACQALAAAALRVGPHRTL